MGDKSISEGRDRRSPRRRHVLWASAAVVLVALIWLVFLPDPVVVDVAEAVRSSMQVTIEEDGRTRVKDRFLISAPTTGNLSRLVLDPGDPVEVGQPMAFIGPAISPLLDARTRDAAQARVAAARAALEQANAAIARGEVALAMAEEELTRQQVLLELGTGTPFRLRQGELQYKAREEELHSAQFGADVARHEVESALSSLRRLDAGRGATDEVAVTSPVAGQILNVLNEGGGLVQAGTPLLEVGDPRSLEVVVDVLTSDAVRITPGCHVALTRWGGDREIEGAVHRVEPSAFTKISALGVEEQRVNVVIDLVDGEANHTALGDGYQVDVAIIIWQGDVLNVPSGAVFPVEDGWGAYVIEGGRARLRPVVAGERNADRVQIIDGLSAGETVVVYPSDEVTDGARIEARAG